MESLPIFVYGTLKRGEIRERCWPHPPLTVEPAWTAGWLYHLDDYPGLRLPGEGETPKAGGELWSIAAEHYEATLGVLDEIEGCYGRSDDLYSRRVVPCQTFSSQAVITAQVYVYNDLKRLDRLTPLAPNENGVAYWSGTRLSNR